MRRLGICVSATAAYGVIVHRDRVVWHACSPVSENEGPCAALERLVSGMPQSGLRRPAANLVLGLAHSHVKRIEGAPLAGRVELLNRVVQENVDSFFLRLGTRTSVGALHRGADGSLWAAGFDDVLLHDVVAVLRRRGHTPRTVLPFAAAAACVLSSGTWCVCDGDRRVELTTIEGGAIQACRRNVVSEQPATVPALREIGAAYLGAYGSTLAPRRAPLAWRPPRHPSHTRVLDAVRIAAASIMFVVTTSAALVARGAHANRVASAAVAELSMFGRLPTAAARVDAELRKATIDLDRVRQFDATRGGITMLLGSLSESLPESTAIVSLHVDSLEANLVALAPHAADILPSLLGLAEVVSPRIVGSVTRETANGVHLERATIRFRRPRAGITLHSVGSP
jgi:hypothetical protein